MAFSKKIIFFKKSVDILRSSRYTIEVGCRKATYRNGIIAQLGEHLPYKQRVIGSSPIGPTSLKSEYGGIAQLARAHGSYPWCR